MASSLLDRPAQTWQARTTQYSTDIRGSHPQSLVAPYKPSQHPRRVVLYSHDTQGLGHMRRNLLIAKALQASSLHPDILLIGGARELGALDIPTGIDCLTLPALGKNADGSYHPRSLSVSLRRLVALRSNTIRAAIEAFDPDVLLVDKVPLGAFDELEPSLRWLRLRGRARCVLGLREILDEPAITRREWAEHGTADAIRRYFDAVWVYGDPAIFNPVSEYGWGSEIAAKMTFTGYMDRSHGTEAHHNEALIERLAIPDDAAVALCCVGGGQDGADLALAFAGADLPAGTVGVIITGPFMPPDAQRALQVCAAANPNLRVLAFVPETATLLRRASHVVAMGGYNTVSEILAFEKCALIVPRIHPRREQLIRAERLAKHGLLDMLHPNQLSSAAISTWLAHAAPTPRRQREQVDLNGLARLPRLLESLCVAQLSPFV